MSKIRVPVLGTVGRAVTIDDKATEGATIGENLRFADGSPATLDALVEAINPATDDPVVSPPSGRSVYVANVYQRAASAPSTPTADDGSFNFTTQVLTPPSGWSTTVPAGSDPLYVSSGSFSIIGNDGTDNTVTWTSPDLIVQDGADGGDGVSVHVANVYQRAASAPSTPAADDGSYNFTTQTLTPPSGWSTTPPAGSDPLYVSTGGFSVVGATGIDNTVTWTSPDLLVQDGATGATGATGADGDDGLSVYVANVYQRAASAPSTPAADDGSYNFTTQTLTPPTGWSTTPPAGTDPLYVSTGSFSIVGTTGTDNTVTWTAPDILVQDGVDAAELVADPNVEKGASFWDVSSAGVSYSSGTGTNSTDSIQMSLTNIARDVRTAARRGPDVWDVQSSGSYFVEVRWRMQMVGPGTGSGSLSAPSPRVYVSDASELNLSQYPGTGVSIDSTDAGTWFDYTQTIEVTDTGTPPRYIQVGFLGTNAFGAQYRIDYVSASIVGAAFGGTEKPGVVAAPASESGQFLKDDGTFDTPDPGITAVVDDTTPVLGGEMDANGNPISEVDSMFMDEKASADADRAGQGQWWVLNDTPNTPWFTDDAGNDQLVDPSVSEINTQNGNYTCVRADKGKTIRKATSTASITHTIPANSSVPYPIGTLIGFENEGTVDMTIAITTDTMTGTDGNTGSRTLGPNQSAIAQKMTATTWKYVASDL